jgi:hypothetical protein
MLCEDCRVDTGLTYHYYMLHNPLWRRAAKDGVDILCLDCVERRIGRKLYARDFRLTPLEMVLVCSTSRTGADIRCCTATRISPLARRQVAMMGVE